MENRRKNANIAAETFQKEMIEFLKISNLALMDEARVEFSEGFTAVTGETGAGKSVMLGALSLLAGNRRGREIIREGADSCKVEALISFSDTSEIDAFLEKNGLRKCDDGSLVVSRVISREKSGRVFINGTLAPLSALAELGPLWIDFHGPQEPQKLFSAKNQLLLLDNYCRNDATRAEYMRLYSERARILSEMESLKNSKSLSADEAEFISSQIEAIDAVNPTDESISELERLSRIAEMSSQIVENTGEIYELLEGENGANASIARAKRLADGIGAADEAAEALARRLEDAAVELSDVAEEYARLARSCDMDESRIEDVRAKMSEWLALSRKYGPTPELVRKARGEMAKRLEMQSDIGASIHRLDKAEKEILKKLSPLADEIFESRKRGAKALAEAAEKMLSRLGFKNASLKIEAARAKEPSPDCGSTAEFMFTANAGHRPQPLAKIASSGELARVMLALKTVLAEADNTPVLVFDEVDANVGGEIGMEVGKALAGLSLKRQVFCVTHLPQVAARANGHLLVEKTQTKDSTSVRISAIDADRNRRICELARMLGDRSSPSALAHAEKLLENRL